MPKVTVIIPVYNVRDYIERCARSLFAQTLKDIEYVFVDDCSPDDSIEIVKKLLDSYPERKKQVKIYRMPHNSGLPTVRKVGISMATGEYIAHCDSDDWTDVSAYEKMYDCARKQNLDIVYCDYYKSDGVNHKYIKQIESNRFMLGPVWNKLVRASLYKNPIIYPTANKAEDGALMVQLSYYAKSRGHVKSALYYYFINPESMCRIPTEEACVTRMHQECENVELRIRFLKEHRIEEEYKGELVVWKLTARKNLLALVKEKKYYDLWLNTYPEINKWVLSCKKMPMKSKLLYLIVKLRIYPSIQKIFRLH